MNFVTIDIETNGAVPENDDLLLLSATKIVNGEIAETFSRLVKPSRPQTEELELFTGISNDDLEDADESKKVISEFMEFAKDCVIVSYDDFEYIFLNNKGFTADKVICLRNYIKKTYPDLQRYIVDAVVISLGLEAKLKEYVSSSLFYEKTRLFYSLKVAVVFLSVIENFLSY